MINVRRQANGGPHTTGLLGGLVAPRTGPVPCGGFSACCYYAGIPVDRKRNRRRLPHLLTSRTAMANWCSRGARTGPAFTWAGRVCTVYEHRPSVCRSFDCRAFSALGLVEYCDPYHRTPDWQFVVPEVAGP